MDIQEELQFKQQKEKMEEKMSKGLSNSVIMKQQVQLKMKQMQQHKPNLEEIHKQQEEKAFQKWA